MKSYEFGKKPWFVVLLSVMGGLIFGYNTGIIVGALNPIGDLFNLNTIIKGIVVCSILLGCLIGAVGGGMVADRIGRKPIILFVAICTIGGAIGSSVVSNVVAICIIRVILGLGVGCASSVCPLMVSEVVPKEKKGIYGSFFQIAITVGILIANVLALVLKNIGPNNWRWMFAIGSVPGFPLIFIWLTIQESPIYLEKKRQQAIDRLNNSTSNTAGNYNQQGSIMQLFAKKNRKPMFTGFVLAVVAQLTGINAFMYFSTDIFKDAGIKGTYGPDIAAIVLQIWNVSTTLIAIFLVDRVGRKVLLFTGAAVMTVCDLLIALFFVVLTGEAKGWASIVFLFIFIAGFEASIGTLFWFVINEILPQDIKNIGSPIINAMQWFFNLLLSFFFLSVVHYLGQSVMFWIFGGIGLICTLGLFILLPPLKNANSVDQSTEDLTNVKSNQTTFDKSTIEDENNSSSSGGAQQMERELMKLKEFDRVNNNINSPLSQSTA
ncbi:sugar transporter family protein [Tieghemostelium lacteum]|uniref:Sugar transporter family protein n=1 Tax=Tieghemostelium lacteum TaxID=361077 RepID=A0A151ZEZ4_TIELA|nr:sugar transporter family protein [Tieghemostelium lacteum]|eukprot:KYQ92533.1 sugar transporter family protein [Tieghemostelium lacteum]